MILNVHCSMGDRLMCTGIPEAYHTLFGEKIHVSGIRYPEFWRYNPYITKTAVGHPFSPPLNTEKDYMIYYPVRIFHDMTDYIVDRDLVQPNIYTTSPRIKDRIIVNDQAGWPSRRGYPYFSRLASELMDLGYEVVYVHNAGYRDCYGQSSPQQISRYSWHVSNQPMAELIDLIASAQAYVGYDSGIAQLAGATQTPYVLLSSSIPPINTAHNSCIYTTDTGCRRCCATDCDEGCFRYDYTEEIVAAIKNT